MKYNYKRVIAFIADTHVGSYYAIFPDNFKALTGNDLSKTMNKIQRKILNFWNKFLRICDDCKVDTIFALGDMINANNRAEFGIKQLTTDIDEQKRAVIQLLKPLCAGRESGFVSGTGYHESLDTRVHRDIAENLNGHFYDMVANIKLKGTNRTIQISHGSSGAWIYQSMMLEREGGFNLQAQALRKMPQVDLIAKAHWHCFKHLHFPQMHFLQVPCWQAFVPWKGSMKSPAKFIPDIGGCILFIDQEDRMTIHHYLLDPPLTIGEVLVL